jgi:hypothetical protein
MPAQSEAQRRLFAIAEHKPDILYDKNKKILGSMSKSQMHDFAATKGLHEDNSQPDNSEEDNSAPPATKQYGSEIPRTVQPRSVAPRSFVKTKSVAPKLIRVK